MYRYALVTVALVLALLAPARARALDTDFGLKPILEVGFYANPLSDGSDANFILGAEAKLFIHPEEAIGFIAWPGVSYRHMFGAVRRGDAVDILMPAGIKLGPIGIGSGAGFLWDKWRYLDLLYSGTLRFGLPLWVAADVKVVFAYFGVMPQWFLANPNDRDPVDWGNVDSKGFGDEFRWLVGAGVNLGIVRLSAEWQTHIASYGEQHRLGIGIGVGF